jgi:hypothetical protein
MELIILKRLIKKAMPDVDQVVQSFFNQGIEQIAQQEIEKSTWIAPGGSSNPDEATPHKYCTVIDFEISDADKMEQKYGNLTTIERGINGLSSLSGKFYFGMFGGDYCLMYAEPV